MELLLWVVGCGLWRVVQDGALSDASFLVGFMGLYLPLFLLPHLMYVFRLICDVDSTDTG